MPVDRSSLPRRARGWALGVVTLAVLAGGCNGVRVRRVGAPALFEAWHVSAFTACELSARTRQTLRLWGLEEASPRHLDEAAARLHAAALEDPQPDLLFALAEINYQRGREAERTDCGRALLSYYLCAGYAYHY